MSSWSLSNMRKKLKVRVPSPPFERAKGLHRNARRSLAHPHTQPPPSGQGKSSTKPPPEEAVAPLGALHDEAAVPEPTQLLPAAQKSSIGRLARLISERGTCSLDSTGKDRATLCP